MVNGFLEEGDPRRQLIVQAILYGGLLVYRDRREVPSLAGGHFAASTFPAVLSMWMIQKASASSCMIIATTPVPGAKK